jgi:UDP:flavonoid glycosyltransferase YjiC (YdhE family)
LRSRGPDRIARLRRAADLTGFPFEDEVMLHEWLVPFAYRRLPVIAFNTVELELPHEPHPALRYVGPVLGEMPSLPDQEGTRQRLAALYERRERGTSAALIYCAFGAWHKGDDSGFVRRIIAAVGAEPSWDLVIGLGGRGKPADLGEIPSNVHPFEWAPQGEVISHADVAIHHAGVTSVNECVAAGVPMVLYPFDFLDQRGNAARVEFHGLGVVGDRRDTATRIGNRIRSVLEDEAFLRRIERMSRYVARDQAENKPVQAILALVGDQDE